jgi:hypothetical protein
MSEEKNINAITLEPLRIGVVLVLLMSSSILVIAVALAFFYFEDISIFLPPLSIEVARILFIYASLRISKLVATPSIVFSLAGFGYAVPLVLFPSIEVARFWQFSIDLVYSLSLLGIGYAAGMLYLLLHRRSLSLLLGFPPAYLVGLALDGANPLLGLINGSSLGVLVARTACLLIVVALSFYLHKRARMAVSESVAEKF